MELDQLMKSAATRALFNGNCRIARDLLDTQPDLGSQWWCQQFDAYRYAGPDETAFKALGRLLDNDFVSRLTSVPNLTDVYFGVSYIAPQRERALHERLSQVVLDAFFAEPPDLQNDPNPKSVAVVTGNYQPLHSAMRPQWSFIDALANEYDVTLIHLGPMPACLPTLPFVRVLNIAYDGGPLDLGVLVGNDFSLAFFPDIGMTAESILLSNLRIAPVQVAGCGHPVTTGSPHMDYFVTGARAECEETISERYTEQPIILPGFGCVNEVPPFPRPEVTHCGDGPFMIACPWYPQKVTWPLVLSLKRIAERASRPVVFRIFAGRALRSAAERQLFEACLAKTMPRENFEVVGYQGFDDYLRALAECQFMLDSWPFAGCNTVCDAIYAGLPVVTIDGDRWLNKIGAALCSSHNLGYLVAAHVPQYEAMAVKLIDQPKLLADAMIDLQRADPARGAFSRSDLGPWLRAIQGVMREGVRA